MWTWSLQNALYRDAHYHNQTAVESRTSYSQCDQALASHGDSAGSIPSEQSGTGTVGFLSSLPFNRCSIFNYLSLTVIILSLGQGPQWKYGNNSHTKNNYNRVSFNDGSFYDDSLLRPLSIRTEHSRLVVHHCRNWSVRSLRSALLALFRCACVSSFSILVQFF